MSIHIDSSIDTHFNITAANGGKATSSSNYRVKYAHAAWLGGTATLIDDNNTFTPTSGQNTFEISVDGTASGTITYQLILMLLMVI